LRANQISTTLMPMKLTLDLPRNLILESMKHTKASSAGEAVAEAIMDFNRHHRSFRPTRPRKAKNHRRR